MQSQINPRKTYNLLAKSYSEKIDFKPHNAFYDRPNTLSLLPDVAEKKVLDAGCGPGKYAEILLAKGADLTGVDISESMIEEAIKRNGNRGRFIVHDLIELLPFQDQSFDVVICPLVLDYIFDWGPVFSEFNRILKPGGTFVFSITHPFFDFHYYQSDRYFDVEKVSAVWKGFGIPVKVECFRRSMADCLNPLAEAGFMLDKFLEPLPVPEFQKLDPKHYDELIRFPGFLCVKGVKSH